MRLKVRIAGDDSCAVFTLFVYVVGLQIAKDAAAIFDVSINVTENAAVLTRQCTARPCYTASVMVKAPAGKGKGMGAGRVKGGGEKGQGAIGNVGVASKSKYSSSYTYTITINENRLLLSDAAPNADAPCL